MNHAVLGLKFRFGEIRVEGGFLIDRDFDYGIAGRALRNGKPQLCKDAVRGVIRARFGIPVEQIRRLCFVAAREKYGGIPVRFALRVEQREHIGIVGDADAERRMPGLCCTVSGTVTVSPGCALISAAVIRGVLSSAADVSNHVPEGMLQQVSTAASRQDMRFFMCFLRE